MSTTRLKQKLSSIVSSQFPEYIQRDFTTFIEFMELYYKFLEQDQGAQEIIQNLTEYGDIDTTTDAFVKYFLKNYTDLIPETALANKKILVKRIKDLYESKGSSLSFQLLFRLFFNENVDLTFPYEFVLKPSDGTFEQRNSLRIESSDNFANITNRFLRYVESGTEYATPILNIVELTSSTSEVFLDPNFLAPSYDIGDKVFVTDTTDLGGNTIFNGTINPTTTGFIVANSGENFKVGQVYTINFGGGVGTLIRISNTNSSGGITDVKFLNFGHGYPNRTFSVVLDPSKTVSESGDSLEDNTEGFRDDGTVTVGNATATTYVTPVYDNPARYFADGNVSYLASQVLSFSTVTSVPSSGTSGVPAGFASIQFTLGALARYPGEFTTNQGFLSEPDFRLQNDLLYQPFAYQLNTGVDINTFKDLVLQLVHPAGQRLFNNRTIENSIDLNANVELLSRANVSIELHDIVEMLDPITKQANLLLSDSVVMTQNTIQGFPVAADDETFVADSGNLLSNVTYCEIDYFAFGPATPEGNASANYYLAEITEGPSFT